MLGFGVVEVEAVRAREILDLMARLGVVRRLGMVVVLRALWRRGQWLVSVTGQSCLCIAPSALRCR
jgi:hypothetical protein